MNRFLAALALMAICAIASAQAAVITVMKDGSGDYDLLQPAADAAAPGDTLLIGPGRWEEVTPFAFNSGVQRDAHLVVRRNNLTIRGVDRDSVIIGPSVPKINFGDPVGIVVAESIETTRVVSLTFENTWNGVYALGVFYADSCLARACEVGFESVDEIHVSRSAAVGNKRAVVVLDGVSPSTVSECHFVNNELAVSFLPSPGGSVVETIIENGVGGVQFDNTPGEVRDCRISGMTSAGIYLTNSNHEVLVANNVLENNAIHLEMAHRGPMIARHNRFLDAGRYSVWYRAPVEAQVNENDFLSPTGQFVHISGHFSFDPVTYDFTDNYWGTTDPDSIAARIDDLNDDINVRAIVDFEPFATEPVPAPSSTMGRLKAGFGGR